MIDAHAHIQMPPLDREWEALYDRAKAAGLEAIVLVGESVESSKQALALSAQRDDLWATIGLHPEHAGAFGDEEKEVLEEMVNTKHQGQNTKDQTPKTKDQITNKVRAIGEIGLDYHWIDPSDPVAKKAQWDAFEWQIGLANRHDLPIVIHSRDAAGDTLSIIENHRPKYALMHCYSYDVAIAERFLGLDERNMIAFTGILTYPSAGILREVCQVVSLERMVTESDCPYLAPQKYRGQQNEPSYITEIVAEIARIKNTSFEQAAQATGENARRFFGLEKNETNPLLHYQDYLQGTHEILDRSRQEKEPYEIAILGRTFVVYPNVFSPKYFHDTELFAANLPIRPSETVLEIGPGTGVIAIKAIDKGASKVVAIDINPEAVKNTIANVERNGMHNRVDVRQGDLYTPLTPNEKFDTIFWNTPFGLIKDVPISNLEKAVYDPGYHSTERFIKEAPLHLNPGGRILIGFSTTLGRIDLVQKFVTEIGFVLRSIYSAASNEKYPVSFEIFEASVK